MIKPKITTFSVCYYRLAFVKKWIENFIPSLDLDKFDYEIVVVDNGSKDGTKEFLWNYFDTLEIPNIKLILRKDNVGFGKAFHEQFIHFTGDYFVHYASDIICEKGWSKVFVDQFEKDERLGMLAPFYKDNGNNPMVNALQYMLKGKVDIEGRDVFYSGVDFPCNCADGFSMMRMAALREIGGYHVQRIYGGHDACLTKQYLAKKWKVAYTKLWTVEHLMPTPDMHEYEVWKRESQQKLKRVGVESKYNQDKGYFDE